ncbi:response regulator [Nitrosopumilus sp. b1]|nr:response regulator [Nitrosopumilus sp. b1]
MTMNILIAEDNEYTAKQYKTVLEKRGHKVTLTKDGVECVDEFMNEAKYSELFRKDNSPPFDIVLMDHDMPRKNGATAAQEILKYKPNQRLVFLSAYGHGILGKVNDLRDDTVQIIQKPFSLEFLVKKIEGKLIGQRIVGEQQGTPLSITQDAAAIR